MKFNFLLLFLLIGMMTFVSAVSIGEFQLDVDNVTLYQTCNNCTSCNFTRVMGPNNQTILSNLEGTKDGTYYSTDVLTGNFTKVGKYSYIYDCGNAVESETGSIDFEITYTGGELTEEMVTVYFGAIVVLIFFFGLTILLITRLPSGDTTSEDGFILEINNLKHLRPVLWAFSWIIILALMFIISNITIAYLPALMIGNLFFAFYTIMFWVSIIAIPLWFVWILVKIFKDKEMKRMIERGVDIKSTP